MAICCRGKKQKVSHSLTSSIKTRRSSEKHNGILDHQHSTVKSHSSPRPRSHSHFNHHLLMPHDLSRSSANSASSSALTYSYGISSNSSSNPNSYYHQKNPKQMDMSDDEDLPTKDQQKNHVKYSHASQMKQSIVNADMIFYCFEILGNYLFNGKNHLGKHHSSMTNGQFSSSPIVPPTLPNDAYPLFVTWLIGSEQKLRGCIGTFTPMNLAQGKILHH